MGLLYADAVGSYSNPAESGLRGLRADNEWAAPDMDHKWLDAKGEWSVPELRPHVFGAQWCFDGNNRSNTKWERTDEAVGFDDPNPSVGGSVGSSPFDKIKPWSGMKRVTRNGNEMVAIPKFYYKLESYGNLNGLKLQIANGYKSGFSVSPAHMSRDGKGERDVVYIGRYKCSEECRSVSGVELANKTITEWRDGCKQIGSGFYQFDFVALFTIWLLYLVEFAEWNSQKVIGFGTYLSADYPYRSGYTDTMPYHTGTTKSSRDELGNSTQYRNIEGIWDYPETTIDGYRNGRWNIHIDRDPRSYKNDVPLSTQESVFDLPGSGYIIGFSINKSFGFPVFLPKTVGNKDEGTCDFWNGDNGFGAICTNYGSSGNQSGMFGIGIGDPQRNFRGRLMELP